MIVVSVKKFIHLLIIVVLLKGKLSNAYFPKGRLNMAAGGWNAASNGEPMADDSQSENGSRKLMLKGKKMAFDAFTRPKKIKEIGLYEGTCITSSSTSRKEQKRVAFNAVNGQKSTRSLLSKMKELAGFGAFTADYNGPMLHPPKNN